MSAAELAFFTARAALVRSEIIRRDNAASLRAHLRMGMQEVGEFTHCDVVHAVLAYQS
jgi:hypothetical protein